MKSKIHFFVCIFALIVKSLTKYNNMENKKIAIIGGGNIGSSIAEGLVKAKFFKPEDITVTRRKLQYIQYLADIGITIHSDNNRAVADSDIVIIAVKPKNVKDILQEIKSKLKPEKHLLISVVTAESISEMQTIVKKSIPLFRVMPNTAIAIQESMTCISTNNASEDQINVVLNIFEQLGKAIVIDEELMEASTVLGACGIAYALRFIRAASQGGIEIGFSAEIAQKIASQTVRGAATLLIERGLHPEREIDRVTTPQGCTIAGLNEMEHRGFSSSLIKGILVSFNKIT